MSDQRQKVIQQAYHLLAQRDHSRAELVRKLSLTCPDQEIVNTVLDDLQQQGLQNDQHFAENFIYHSINKGYGALKIQHRLKQRGIDSHLIETVLQAADIDWLELAEKVRIKKYAAQPPTDYQNKAKQSRFLYSRGFDSDIINQLFK